MEAPTSEKNNSDSRLNSTRDHQRLQGQIPAVDVRSSVVKSFLAFSFRVFGEAHEWASLV